MNLHSVMVTHSERRPVAGNKVTIEYLQVKGAAANNAKSFTAVNRVTPIVGGDSFDVDVVTNIKSIGGRYS